jgi:hypothetical protein
MRTLPTGKVRLQERPWSGSDTAHAFWASGY